MNSGENDQLEYIMISEINFERLALLPELDIIVDEQVYEDVPGFESLRKVFSKIFYSINFISSETYFEYRGDSDVVDSDVGDIIVKVT